MKQPPLDGVAISESLYGSDDEQKTTKKVANPTNTINLFPRPSLIPGVEYPTTEREEKLLTLAWLHACKLAAFHWFDKREDDFLDYMRREVERIRKEDLGYE